MCRCDNVGGIGEHVTCHMFRFLNILFGRPLMARWKARVDFLLSVIELLFLSLTVEALQGKMCQNSLPSGGGGSV